MQILEKDGKRIRMIKYHAICYVLMTHGSMSRYDVMTKANEATSKRAKAGSGRSIYFYGENDEVGGEARGLIERTGWRGGKMMWNVTEEGRRWGALYAEFLEAKLQELGSKTLIDSHDGQQHPEDHYGA